MRKSIPSKTYSLNIVKQAPENTKKQNWKSSFRFIGVQNTMPSAIGILKLAGFPFTVNIDGNLDPG